MDGRSTVNISKLRKVRVFNPDPVREGTRQTLIKHFLETGESHHSGRACTLGYIIQYCEENALPYTLTAVPGFGYHIAAKPDDPLRHLGDKGGNLV